MAVVSVAAAACVRAGFASLIGNVRFLPFFPAVIGCALWAGPVSGVVATLLSAVVLACWFGPLNGIGSDLAAAFALLLFVATGFMTVWLAERVRRGRADLTATDDARLRLAAIVESSDDSIVSKGLEGVVQSWNAAAARLYGYEPADIIGRSIVRLIPPDLLGEQRAAIERLRRGERVEPFETIRLHQSGTPVRVMVTISPLKADGGRVIGAVEIARGMGERLQTEAALRRAKADAEQNVAQLRAVIDSMSEGVIIADPDGTLVEWTRPALLAHGYTSVDQVRAHISTFVNRFELSEPGKPPLDLNDWPMQRVLRGESFRDVELLVRRLDEPRDLIVNYGGQPVYDAQGRLMMAVLTLHDVTAERRAQQAVHENAERLSLALDAAEQGDWSWDTATDRVILSPAAAALFGVKPDPTATREALREIIHVDDRDRARRASELAVETRTDYEIEYRLNRPADDTRWVAAKGRGQYDAGGKLVRMLGVVQDVTPRRLADQALRESREWLELAVSIAQMGTFRLDLKASQLTLNEAGRTIYGFGPDAPLTNDVVFARFHPEDAHDAAYRLKQALRASGTRRFEMEHRIVRTDGQVRWVRVRGRTLFDDTADGPKAAQCVGTFIDVTEQKEAERDREQLLAAEQAARVAAEHASRVKDEFLATLGHELRTPLNAILGWSQILSAADAVSDDVRQGVEVIERNARSQAQIIDDLLDMSRIISGKVRLLVQPVELAELVATAVDSVRPTAAAKGVQLIGAPSAARVNGDAHRLQQVLWNLLTNAIKFTPRGGEVRLGVTVTGSGVELSVADTGEGIRPDFLPHVFDRFRQADASTTRRHGGLGLGLALVKQLAELHGGSVHVASAGVGRGATFTVTLPTMGATLVAESGPDAPPEIETGDESAKSSSLIGSVAGLRVLVIDDEPDARHLVRRLLEDRDAIVSTAGSVAEAMHRLKHEPRPDVMVSDIGMPGEDGYTFITRVRAVGIDVPAVALTAYARAEDRARVLAAGFQTHLAKPVDLVALLATVAKLGGR